MRRTRRWTILDLLKLLTELISEDLFIYLFWGRDFFCPVNVEHRFQTQWKETPQKTHNLLWRNMSCGLFCFSFLHKECFIGISRFFLYFLRRAEDFLGQTIRAAEPPAAASTPTAPFVHISVTAELPGQSPRFPRPLSSFRRVNRQAARV